LVAFFTTLVVVIAVLLDVLGFCSVWSGIDADG